MSIRPDPILARVIGQGQERWSRFLAEMVDISSPSGDTQGLARLRELVGCELATLGFVPLAENGAGGHLAMHRAGQGPKVLFLAHLDTVLEADAIGPLRVEDDRWRGVGVADCKGGIAVLRASLEALREASVLDRLNVVVVLTADEEVGSEDGRQIVNDVATGADMALVFEPARPTGDVVVSRSGNCVYQLDCRGRAAHAALARTVGINAIEELAHKVVQLQKLNRDHEQISVNVGVIRGGLKPNVVPEDAEVLVDLRFESAEAADVIERHVLRVASTSFVDGTTTSWQRSRHRPAWPAGLDSTARLFTHWREAGRAVGVSLTSTSTSGSSDGNFTAAAGVPTLDGLGIVGGNYHTATEFAVVESLVERSLVTAIALASLPAFDRKETS